MQSFGPDMRVAARHLPVLVTGDEGDLFDGKAGSKVSIGYRRLERVS